MGIALCRTLGVPARYVSAYAWRLEPPDFHAVSEAFLCGPSGPGWYDFDPTRMADPQGIVRIGIGRDAAEVAFRTQFGEMDYDKPEVSIRARSFEVDFNLKRESLSQTYKPEYDRFNLKRSYSGGPVDAPAATTSAIRTQDA